MAHQIVQKLYREEGELIFSSKFDNGNMGKVTLLTSTTEFQFEILTVSDQQIHKVGQNPYPKSWFHFTIQGLVQNTTYRMIIRNVNLLWPLYNNQIDDAYKPVYRIQNKDSQWTKWSRIENELEILGREDQIDIHFKFSFDREDIQVVAFAFTYVYTYEDNIEFMKSIKQNKLPQNVYLKCETLIQSLQNRNIHLLTISEESQVYQVQQQIEMEHLFPFRAFEQTSLRFDKPIIFITARVHPGESPSSYVVDSIIRFLLSDNKQASQLRKYFMFLIIPMLNPDGVFNGYYRMDSENNNLNRHYKNPNPLKHPSIYAAKEIANFYNKQIMFYFDLHAHGARKTTFTYGNALEDFLSQVQNQLFAKVLSLNCPAFDYDQCNFSRKHMVTKDRFEELSKEGCGRVCIQQTTNSIYCYTIECGYYIVSEEQKPGKVITNCPQTFELVGQQILNSILDLFQENNQFHNICKFRQQIANEVTKYERFRHYQSAKNIKNINELYEKTYRESINQIFQVGQQFKPLKLSQSAMNQHRKPQQIKQVQKSIDQSQSKLQKITFLHQQKPVYKDVNQTNEKQNFSSQYEQTSIYESFLIKHDKKIDKKSLDIKQNLIKFQDVVIEQKVNRNKLKLQQIILNTKNTNVISNLIKLFTSTNIYLIRSTTQSKLTKIKLSNRGTNFRYINHTSEAEILPNLEMNTIFIRLTLLTVNQYITNY